MDWAHRARQSVVAIILAIPAIAYISWSLSWDGRHLTPITGDEPHYLIVADAIAQDGSLSVRSAYDRDAAQKRIAGPIDWQNHSVTGRNGTFSIHDVGLPILIASAFKRFGLRGVRIELGLIVGVVPFLLFRAARIRGIGYAEAVALALGTSCGLPFLIAAGQIYPDLISGVLLLALATIALGATRKAPGLPTLMAAGAALAVLPWLHIKNLPATLIIGTTIALVRPKTSRFCVPVQRALGMFIPVICFIGLLAWYRYMAFGQIAGPLTAHDAAGATLRQAGMIFLGLHFDQLEGVFANQPALLCALCGLAVMWRTERRFAIGLCLTYLSVLVPNSLHPCWYGCWSLGGRFMWSVAALWVVPLVFLYSEVRTVGRTLILTAVCTSLAVEVGLAFRWWQSAVRLYSRLTIDPLTRNSLFPPEFKSWLPSFFDSDTYLWRRSNLVVETVAIGLIVAGIYLARRARSARPTPSIGRRSWLVCAATLLGLLAFVPIAIAPSAPVDLIQTFASAKRQPSAGGTETFDIVAERIGDRTELALLTRAPARLTWTMRIPNSARLTTKIGVTERAWDQEGDGVLFRIGVSDDRGYRELFNRHVNPHLVAEDRGWIDIDVDLSEFEGRRVEIILDVDASLPGRPFDPRNDFAYWAKPTIQSGY